jgi:putative glutamine amidotransferase
VINVALAGGLLQDVGDHRQTAERGVVTHGVEVARGSRLAALTGERVDVNSFHHQVVDPQRLGRGLRVTAFSADGTRLIEALESEDGRIQAVQWHPEDLTDRRWARNLFASFVEEARKATRKGTAGPARKASRQGAAGP